MSTTLFGVHTQTELAAALAVIAQENGSAGACQIVLTGDVDLAGSLIVPLGGDGARLTITTAGHAIAGTGTLAVSGRGTLVLDGNNTFTGGIEFASGTLDLATRGGAGSGRIHLTGGTDGTPQLLRVHGTAMPINPIAIEYGGGMENGRPYAYAAVDLADIAATAQYTSFADDGSITVPTAAGPVRLTFSAARGIGFRGGSRVSLLPDGAGGTLLMSFGQYPDPAVTIIGAGGTPVATGFDDVRRNATVQALANAVSAGVIAGRVVPIDNAGGVLQGIAGGTIEAFVHLPVAVALPDAPAALISDAPTSPVVFGGAADGQLVLAGAAGLVFAAGTGAGSVVAGGGNSLVNIPLGNAGEYVDLGAGNDTVVAPGGNNTIAAGLGRNMLWLGAGGSQVVATGEDTIVGGPGNAIIDATQGPLAANVLAWLGPAGSLFTGGAGRNTVISGAGSDTITTNAGASLLWLGSGGATIDSHGLDTIIGGAGLPSVTAQHALIFGGPGSLFANVEAFATTANTVIGGSGSATIVGASLVFGGSGAMLVSPILNGNYPYGSYATTVVGGSGAATVNGASLMVAGTGPLLFNSSANATIVGNPAGQATISTYGSVTSTVLYADGDTRFTNSKAPYSKYNNYYGFAADTVIGVGGKLTVAFASDVLVSAPAGGSNAITVGGASTVIGGGSGDVITAIEDGVQSDYRSYSPYYYAPQYTVPSYAAAAPVLLAAGPGAETVSAAGFRGDATLIGGSGPDLLIAGDGYTTILAGTGAATMVGGAPFTYDGGITGTTFAFTAGSASDVRVENFQSGPDFINLQNFPAGEVEAALAGAVTQGSDTLLTLSDGTHITFAGFTDLTAANFI